MMPELPKKKRSATAKTWFEIRFSRRSDAKASRGGGSGELLRRAEVGSVEEGFV